MNCFISFKYSKTDAKINIVIFFLYFVDQASIFIKIQKMTNTFYVQYSHFPLKSQIEILYIEKYIKIVKTE